MKIGDLVFNLSINCKYCGHNFYKVKYVKPHVGLYCSSCGKWHKWLSKQEKKEYGIITPEDLQEDNERLKAEKLNEFRDEVLKKMINSIDDEELPWE